MQFNRMVATNPERLADDDPERFFYNVTTPFVHTVDQPANHFCVEKIELLDNGWVKVTNHKEEGCAFECFPPHRVIALEGNYEFETADHQAETGSF